MSTQRCAPQHPGTVARCCRLRRAAAEAGLHCDAAPAAAADMVSAFCALGGNPDKTGNIKTDKLREVIERYAPPAPPLPA